MTFGRNIQKSHNARQFITKFLNKGWMKNSINRLLVKFRTVDRRPCSGRHTGVLMITSTLDTVYSLLLSQEDKSQRHGTVREISREAGGGGYRSSVSRIIHKDPTEAHSMHALFSVCSLRDDNVKNKQST